jgi:hypothetical protein
LNLTQAITLRKQIEEQHFPVQLLSNGKEGYLFLVAEELVDNSSFLFLEKFALENKLSLVFGQGYCILLEP